MRLPVGPVGPASRGSSKASTLRIRIEFTRVPLQLGEVVEGIGFIRNTDRHHFGIVIDIPRNPLVRDRSRFCAI